MLELVTWPRSSWSIFDELESLQEDMNRMLAGRTPGGRSLRDYGRRRRPTYPPMNIWSSADGIIIDAELPGVDPKDLDISVKGAELTLRGKVNAGDDGSGEAYHRRERPAGEFSRTLQLPFRVESGAVKAAYRNGLLRLTLPRSEEEKPRKVAIEAS